MNTVRQLHLNSIHSLSHTHILTQKVDPLLELGGGVWVTLCLPADSSRRQCQACCQVVMPRKTASEGRREEGGVWSKLGVMRETPESSGPN